MCVGRIFLLIHCHTKILGCEGDREREVKTVAIHLSAQFYILWYACAGTLHIFALRRQVATRILANKWTRRIPKPRIRSHSLISFTHPPHLRTRSFGWILCGPLPARSFSFTDTHTAHNVSLSLARSLAAHMKCGIVVSTVHVNTVRCALTLIGITLKIYTIRHTEHIAHSQISNSTNFETPNSVHAHFLLLLLLYVYWVRECALFEPKRPSIRIILFIQIHSHSLTHIKYISM